MTLLNHENYDINPKTGKIKIRERVSIQCDRCSKQWTTTFSVYKNKKLEHDYCRSCKNSLGIGGVKGGHSSHTLRKWSNGVKKVNNKTIVCKACNSKFERHISQIHKNNFCSIQCRVKYANKKRYGDLHFDTKEKQNAIAYICGLILGDGNIKWSGKETARVTISFDKNKPELIKKAERALQVIGIKYSITDRPCNVFIVGFGIMKNVLSRLCINFNGDKMRNQPFPAKSIISNINFATGLINSDGYFAHRKSTGKNHISFVNTVDSIANALCECLDGHGIGFTRKENQPVVGRKRINVNIYTQDDIEKIKAKADFSLQKIRRIK